MFFQKGKLEMKISAVISEFNPFHSGHKYLIDKIRENGATHIVAVMSGNFVQRGECAVFSKWDRVETALKNGIDLVVENPLVYATASAQRFAYGGVNVVKGLGCVDELSFGSECGDIELISKVADLVSKNEFNDVLQVYLKQGLSFPQARERAISEKYGKKYADVLSSANNILACEYISECKKAGLNIDYYTVSRAGVEHDSDEENNGFSSASHLRNLLRNSEKSNDKIFESIRNNCKVYDFSKIETATLVKLRSFTQNDFLKLPDVSEGMENRLYNASQNAITLEEVYDLVKTKRYTYSRIRRICLSALLDITKGDISLPVPYVRVLGFNEKGKDILRLARENSTLPVVMKYSDIKELDENANRIFEIESKATDIFKLATDEREACGTEKTANVIKI